MILRVLICALLMGAVGVAGAQTSTAAQQPASQAKAQQQLTPEQRAAIQKRNETLVKYANQILAMIDNGQIGEVWDQASEVAKKAVTRDKFVDAVKAARAKLGAAKGRKIVAMYQSTSDGKKQLPAGTYVNIRYQSQFADSTQPAVELVSFHLDSDQRYRLSGYTVGPAKAAPAK